MEEEQSRAATEPAVTPAIDAAEVPRRGRGRPRKPQQETVNPPAPKRPRGRPKGSKNKTTRTALKEPPKQKRPRGRPRKWPQQAVQHQEQELEEDEDQPHLPSPLGSEPASSEPCVH